MIRDQMSVVDALTIIGMPVGSKMEDIKKKYHKMAMKYHPDRNPNSEVAERIMKRLNVAYEVCCKYVIAKAKQPPRQPPGQPVRRPGTPSTGWVTFTVTTHNINFSGVTITFV